MSSPPTVKHPVECRRCGTVTDTPTLRRVPYHDGTGEHIRGDCPVCRRYVRFIARDEILALSAVA